MTITRKKVAEKIGAYLHHRISLAELVDWAERTMMDAEFTVRHADSIREVVARLGLADVRAFGLTWEDCEDFLERMGYSTRVEIVAATVTHSMVRERPTKRYGR